MKTGISLFLYLIFLAPLWFFQSQALAKAVEPCIPIESMEISGNISFSDSRLKMRTKTWSKILMPWGENCLNLQWLKKDKNNLISFYRSKGFADISISHEILINEKNKKKTLCIIIKEGLEYKLSFKGTEFYYPWQLKKEIEIFKKGNPGDRELKKGTRNLQKRYESSGFKNAEIAFTKKKITQKKREFWDVIYRIKEKERTRIASVVIRGNVHVPENQIREVMMTSGLSLIKQNGFSQKTLDEDIMAIERLYLGMGFRESKIKATVKEDPLEKAKPEGQKYPEKKVHIGITILENDQTFVNTVTITGFEKVLDEKKVIPQLTLRPKQPFREYMIKSDENIIASLVSEKGYPHVRVKGKVVNNEYNRNLGLNFHIDRGKFTRVGEISYTGNTRIKKKLMSNVIKVKPNDPFSLKEIVTAEKKLRKIKAIKSVHIQAKGLQEQKKRADLEVIIEEKLPYYVETILGHDTEQLFYLNAEAGDNNFLGRDIDSWVKVGISGIGYEGEIGIRDPFFMATDITASTALFVKEEEDLNTSFNVKTWGISNSITKPLTPHLNGGLSLTYENRVRSDDKEDSSTLKESDDLFETRNILNTSLFLAYDTRDSAVRPRSGTLSSMKTEVYTGFDNDLDDFIKYSMDLRQYLTPAKRLTLALRTGLGYIQPFTSSSTVAEDRLFFMGGTSDVRGFKKNMLAHDLEMDPAGGRSMVSASLESRMAMTDTFEFIMFLDGGRLGLLDDNAISHGFRSSLGGGLSYTTVIGPISLLYGHKLNPEEDESPGQIHFSVGYTF